MSNKPEALKLADELDAMFGATEIDERVTTELRRLHAENERLNNALQWEQNRFEHIGTHGPGCHTWGHRHYECLLREYKSLLDALTDLIDLYDGRKHEGFAIVSNARAAITKATGGDA